jgi:hypothetical protein
MPPPLVPSASQPVHDAVFVGVTVTDDGAPVNPNRDFESTVLTTLTQTNVFRRIYKEQGLTPDNPDPYLISLAVVAVGEKHEVANFLKGLITGTLLFLPSPVITYKHEYIATMTLNPGYSPTEFQALQLNDKCRR